MALNFQAHKKYHTHAHYSYLIKLTFVIFKSGLFLRTKTSIQLKSNPSSFSPFSDNYYFLIIIICLLVLELTLLVYMSMYL